MKRLVQIAVQVAVTMCAAAVTVVSAAAITKTVRDPQAWGSKKPQREPVEV